MSTPAYFTAGAMERLRARLTDALADYRKVCDSNPEAAEAGDNSVWHDNFAFEENQRRMHMLACRVRELDLLVKRAVIVAVPSAPLEVVIGCHVAWRFDGEATVRSCELASFDDGDKGAARVSYNSPLGRALLGAKVDDFIELKVAGKQRLLQVLGVTGAEALECPV